MIILLCWFIFFNLNYKSSFDQYGSFEVALFEALHAREEEEEEKEKRDEEGKRVVGSKREKVLVRLHGFCILLTTIHLKFSLLSFNCILMK